MIYEMRTDIYLPGGHVEEFEQKMAKLIDHRNTFSRLGAFWKVEIGPLNQAIHVWPYDSLQHREEIRIAVSKDGGWPAKEPSGQASVWKGLLASEKEILTPAPFMRPWGEVQVLGSIYEIRTYYCKPGTISEMIKRWDECISFREKLSPLAACWYTEFGAQFKWINVWPYQSLEERSRLRAEALKDSRWHWPPPTQELIERQEVKIVVPAPFSTMR